MRLSFVGGGDDVLAIGMMDATTPKWQAQLWSVKGAAKKKKVLLEREGSPRTSTAAPNGKEVAIGTWEGEIVLLNVPK